MLGLLARVAEVIGKRLRADPLFYLSVAGCLGILIGDSFPKAVLYGAAFAVLLGHFIWSAARGAPRPIWLLGLAVMSAFAAVHACHLAASKAFPLHERLRTNDEGAYVEVVGRISNEPRPLGGYGLQAVLDLETLQVDEVNYHIPHRLVLHVLEEEIAYGDVVRIRARLYLPEPPRNPGQFDYRTFLRRHDWVGILEVTRNDELQVLAQRPHPFKAIALKARARMAKAITRDIENEVDTCAVLTAMVLGMREQASPELEEPFRFSGTLHIFAVSGLHVGIFALIAWLILKPFGLSRAQVALLLIPLLFFYAFLTGWRPSAVRAATMATIFLAGFCVYREPRLLNSLGLAALLILASNSNQLFLPGFQLSFAVLLSIISFTKALQRPFRLWLYPDPFIPTSLLEEYEQQAYGFRRWLGDIVSVSAAAWLGSLPLMAATFHLVTPVAIFANCLLMPLGFCILLTAALSMLCSMAGVLGSLNILFNNANYVLVHGLLFLAETFAQLPGGHFLVSGRNPLMRPPIEITVLDMPKGGAVTHVEVRGESNELIDVGHRRSFRFLTEPYLQHAGLNTIDRVWLTHGDTGHTGAISDFLSDYNPRVYQPQWNSRSPSMLELDRLLDARGAIATRLEAKESISLGKDAYWEVLYPPEDPEFPPSAADDRALVLRLCGFDWQILFMSDAGFATERWLLDAGIDLKADVLIKGAHGDDVSGTFEFLDAVDPRAVVHDTEMAQKEAVTAWGAQRNRVVLDQRVVGAAILQVSRSTLKLRGFRGDQVFRLKREKPSF